MNFNKIFYPATGTETASRWHYGVMVNNKLINDTRPEAALVLADGAVLKEGLSVFLV